MDKNRKQVILPRYSTPNAVRENLKIKANIKWKGEGKMISRRQVNLVHGRLDARKQNNCSEGVMNEKTA